MQEHPDEITETDFVALAMSMPINHQISFMKAWHEAAERGKFLPTVLGRSSNDSDQIVFTRDSLVWAVYDLLSSIDDPDSRQKIVRFAQKLDPSLINVKND